MTAASLKPAGPSGLLGKLMAEVRSEFRSDILEFGAEDPVFGGAECRVVGYAEPPAAGVCGKDIGNGGTTKDARPWSGSSRRQLEQSEGDFRRFASAIHQVACDL